MTQWAPATWLRGNKAMRTPPLLPGVVSHDAPWWLRRIWEVSFFSWSSHCRGSGGCYVWLPAGVGTNGRVRRRRASLRIEIRHEGGLASVRGHGAVSGFGLYPLA